MRPLVVGLVEVYEMKSKVVAFPGSWEEIDLLIVASSFLLQVASLFLNTAVAVLSLFSDFLLIHSSLLRSEIWPDLVALHDLLDGWPSSSFGCLSLALT